MTINQDIASGERWQVIRAEQVPMGQEQTAVFHQHLLPGSGEGKMQQHLVNFAVTVAANGDDARGKRIEFFRHLRGGIAFRQRVTWAVV